VPSYCPCAKQVRCKPCNGIANLEGIVSGRIISECPCAPKPQWRGYPPLSLLQEIASKKVFFKFTKRIF